MPYQFEGRYECRNATSDKFYEIHENTNGRGFICTWGRIGTEGTSMRKTYDEVMKKVNEFSSKGYRKVSGSTNTRQSRPTPTPELVSTPTSRLDSIDSDDIKSPSPKTSKEDKPIGRLGSI